MSKFFRSRSRQSSLGALVGLIHNTDDLVDQWWENIRGVAPIDRLYYSASALGDWSLIWHLAGTAQGVLDHERGWHRATRLAAALGVESALVNGAVKSLFRRTRPVASALRPYKLRIPVTSSFPSGHASSAFMAARLLSDQNHQAPLWYALAALVSTSRVHVRIHHASDVLAGAALGVLLGEVAVRIAPLPPLDSPGS